MIIRLPALKVFVHESGEAFALLDKQMWYNGEVLYSPDGRRFYALDVKGFSSVSSPSHLLRVAFSFLEPRSGLEGRLEIEGGVLKYDERKYVEQTDFPLEWVTIIPPASHPVTRYMYECRDGRWLCIVSEGRSMYDVKSFRLFVGRGLMEEFPLCRLEPYETGVRWTTPKPGSMGGVHHGMLQGLDPGLFTFEDGLDGSLTIARRR